MRVDLFDYELDPARIAQEPSEGREDARLMVLGPLGKSAAARHATIAGLPELVPAGALVVVNDTRVLRARLLGTKRGTGGRAEILLVRKRDGDGEAEVWSALGRASKGLKEGAIVDLEGLEVRVLQARQGPDALLRVRLGTTDGTPVRDAIERVGHVPLPPYIRRDGGDGEARAKPSADAERYQTVFARAPGAVAAPTAGLHLTNALLDRLRARGCTVATVTLHVGLGTFQPVVVADLDAHVMHEEWFEIPDATAVAIEAARARGAPVLAIGTTVVRALESAATADGSRRARAMAGDTRLLIQPGYRFQVVDLLLTNLHLPRSTLLALVCAFAGTERVLDAYRTAHAEGYRFFSYGDAMLVWPERP